MVSIAMFKRRPSRDEGAELMDRQSTATQRGLRIAAREAQVRRAEDELFVKGLMARGCLLPEGIVSFMGLLSVDETIELSDGSERSKTSPRSFFKEFLSATTPATADADRGLSSRDPGLDAIELSESISDRVYKEASRGQFMTFAEAAHRVTRFKASHK